MKLSFFFPYHQISGVPVLFSNIINNIIEDKSIEKIYTIDYENGALNKLCNDSPKLERRFFYNNKKIIVPQDSILIMQSLIPYTIRHELVIKKNIKIFFWNLHPENLIPNYIPISYLNNIIKANYKIFKKPIDFIFRSRLRLIRRFIELCISKKSLLFMDSTNLYNTIYKINCSEIHDIDFLPVPVKDINFFSKKKYSKSLSVSWVGRIEEFKFHILKFILTEISKYSEKNMLKIKFHLIGDGIRLNEIRNSRYENKFFKIKFYGNKSYSDLQELLKNKINFSFAMGTSAMDSAKLGIPTILVDYSYKKIRNYKFRWIFDTKSFNLAHDINNNNYDGPSYELHQILNQLDNNFDDLSKKSSNYVRKNHSLNDISKKFLDKVCKSELKFGEIDQNILKKSIFRRLYYKLNNYYTGTS